MIDKVENNCLDLFGAKIGTECFLFHLPATNTGRVVWNRLYGTIRLG